MTMNGEVRENNSDSFEVGGRILHRNHNATSESGKDQGRKHDAMELSLRATRD